MLLTWQPGVKGQLAVGIEDRLVCGRCLKGNALHVAEAPVGTGALCLACLLECFPETNPEWWLRRGRPRGLPRDDPAPRKLLLARQPELAATP